jgi:hypothetical protein
VVVVMKIVPTSSYGGRGDQEDTSRAVSGRTAAVVTMGENCGCLGVHSINYMWKLPTFGAKLLLNCKRLRSV